MSLQNILPPVSIPVWDKEFEQRKKSTDIISATRAAPPYEHRKGWFPRQEEDYGDGGAFPECQMAQYPMGMGKDSSKKSDNNSIAVQLDETGKIKYDVLTRQGHGKDKIVYSKLSDLLPSAVTSESDPELQKPNEKDIQDITEKTRQALEKLTQNKISSAMPVRCAEKQSPAQFLQYTPSQQGVAYNSGAKQRVIRMMEMPSDPMEPPKFKINKKVPRGPPSPPAPVMHSPTRKVTVKEQQEWRIPPCVSNWKNTKGYTIPLDKRLAADGRGLQSVHINEKFAKLAEALYIADRKAREQIEMRSQLEKKMVQKEKVRKEENLKILAKKAREDQNVFRPSGSSGNAGEAEREKLRYDRARERKKDHAVSNSKNASRGKITRERDITEQIALGLPQKTIGGEGQFDQRLFNHSKGMDSGFGDDEVYNVYDRPWRENAVSSNIYRPSRGMESEGYGMDVDQLLNSDRFVPDKGFKGMDPANKRTGPVQFQSSGPSGTHEKEEEDLFGLRSLLSEAKNAGKRTTDDRDDRVEKRRKRDRD